MEFLEEFEAREFYWCGGSARLDKNGNTIREMADYDECPETKSECLDVIAKARAKDLDENVKHYTITLNMSTVGDDDEYNGVDFFQEIIAR